MEDPTNTDVKKEVKYPEDVMRRKYKLLSEEEKGNIERVKDLGRVFYGVCDYIGASREMSLAKTRIEEAVMWATKHITR